MKISIIIPVYNVEKYIKKCIQSVKNQTFLDFECILVDDVSPDNSIEIAEKTIGKDNRFTIIRHQYNTRQGGARNTGLDNAKGDWIVFLDSDDEWEENFLERMYNQAVNNTADIVVCKFKKVFDNNIEEHSKQTFVGILTDIKLKAKSFLEDPSPVNKMYRKEVWENIRFPSHIFYEDLATVFKTAFFSNRILFIDESLYKYNQVEGSTTKKFIPQQINDRLKAFDIITDFCKQQNFNDISILSEIYATRVVRSACFNIMKYNTSIIKKNKIIILKEFKLKLDKKYFNLTQVLRYPSLSLRIFGLLFLSSTILTYLVAIIWIKINKK